MAIDAEVIAGADLHDDLVGKRVVASEVAMRGRVWDVQRDQVDLGAAGVVTREFIEHPGAVAIVALRRHAERDQIVLIQQYRHPIRATEWELPAGLLDVDGEEPLLAAARELAEEVDLRAETWHVLTDLFPSPGSLGEAIRIFLARDVGPVPDDERHARDGEELDMPVGWVDLDEAQEAALAGRLGNGIAQLGIHAACAARDRGWSTLRTPDAPWPAHPTQRP